MKIWSVIFHLSWKGETNLSSVPRSGLISGTFDSVVEQLSRRSRMLAMIQMHYGICAKYRSHPQYSTCLGKVRRIYQRFVISLLCWVHVAKYLPCRQLFKMFMVSDTHSFNLFTFISIKKRRKMYQMTSKVSITMRESPGKPYALLIVFSWNGDITI